jgi:hypothetical protein
VVIRISPGAAVTKRDVFAALDLHFWSDDALALTRVRITIPASIRKCSTEFAATLRRSIGFLLSGDEICISYDHKLKKQHHRIKVIPTLFGWILWPLAVE